MKTPDPGPDTTEETAQTGTLFVVATPIGNHQDWTERAKQVLGQVAIVAAEDTRVLKRELSKVQIKPHKVVSHHEHNEDDSTSSLIEILLGGQDVALVSDAGTPLISDPGFRLVQEAIQKKIRVVPIPGASSLTAALSVAALGGKSIFFGGFLPVQSDGRKKFLRHSVSAADQIVFFETPHRLRESLKEAEEIFGPSTPCCICRELTKSYEEILHFQLSEAVKFFHVNEPRGEFVLILKGKSEAKLSLEETHAEISRMLKDGRSTAEIVATLQPMTELPRKQLYDHILKFRKD